MSTPYQEMVEQLRELLPANRPPKVSAEQLAIFTRQFAAMLDAGIPLHRALEFFSSSGENTDLHKVIDRVCNKVSSGTRLSRALRLYPRVFSEVYASLVETGEQSGQLTNVLNRLAEMLEKQVNMQKRLISTLTYPVILMMISMASVAVFVIFVLPMVEPLFKSLKIDLPLPTRMLLASRMLMIPTLVGSILAAFGLWIGQPWVRRFLDSNPALRSRLSRMPLQAPVIGPVLEKIAVSRVLYSLAGMVDAGMSIVPAIARSAPVAGNRWLTEQLGLVRGDIIEGSLISEALGKRKVFPPAAVHVIGVGEETSSITEMVRYAANMYDEEAELALDSMASMLEPLIMGGMGIVVGFIVLSAILPTLQLIQHL